jgi:hypothetical protein
MTDSVGDGVTQMAESLPGGAHASASEENAGSSPAAAPADLLSWSKLLDTDCWRKFYLKRIAGVPQRPQGPQMGGKTVHSIIEWAEKEPELPIAASVGTAFGMEWEAVLRESDDIRWGGRASKANPNGEDANWWFENGPRMLDNYFWLRDQDESQGRRIMQGPEGPVVEAHVLMNVESGPTQAAMGEAPLSQGREVSSGDASALRLGGVAPPSPGQITWHGYVDAMKQDADGLLVDDTKCGRSVAPNVVFQLASYAVGWERTTGEVVERGRAVNLRQRKEPQILDLTEPKKLIDGMYRDLATSIQMHTERDVWPASPSNFCSSCSVVAFCPEGQAVVAMKGDA